MALYADYVCWITLFFIRKIAIGEDNKKEMGNNDELRLF